MGRTSLVEAIASRLLDAIAAGEFETDRPLPGQAELAKQMDVSRLTVREAVKNLAQRGILRVEHGTGTFVNPRTSWADLEALSRLTDGDGLFRSQALLEVRRMLETGAAELCAERSTPALLQQLDDSLVDMQRAVDSQEVDAFVAADIAFHDAILQGTGNPFVAAIFDPMRRQLERSRTETSSVPEIREHALRHHRAIRAAIASGDRRAARAAMDEHMQQTLDDLESFVAGTTPARQADESNRAAS